MQASAGGNSLNACADCKAHRVPFSHPYMYALLQRKFPPPHGWGSAGIDQRRQPDKNQRFSIDNQQFSVFDQQFPSMINVFPLLTSVFQRKSMISQRNPEAFRSVRGNPQKINVFPTKSTFPNILLILKNPHFPNVRWKLPMIRAREVLMWLGVREWGFF